MNQFWQSDIRQPLYSLYFKQLPFWRSSIRCRSVNIHNTASWNIQTGKSIAFFSRVQNWKHPVTHQKSSTPEIKLNNFMVLENIFLYIGLYLFLFRRNKSVWAKNYEHWKYVTIIQLEHLVSRALCKKIETL